MRYTSVFSILHSESPPAGVPPLPALRTLSGLSSRITSCRRCPRLVSWREEVARHKRAAFADQDYWGKPLPGFGDPDAWLLVVGLAPAAHGANRTGRMFTGDRSGDFLYAALHRAGLANQAESTARSDGLELRGAYITAAVRCAPPANRPLPEERDSCRGFLEEELDLLPGLKVILALGGYAFGHVLRVLRDRGAPLPSPTPKFAHGVLVRLGESGLSVIASYHPSQQNTFTGRLTPRMLDRVLSRAQRLR
ncbi:MAG: uracil-DNA glycosylase [Gemmatimonadota bacterium]|nr:MAG: uracil-DNA glycosylase [Gemmatimonadota bacterium]